MKTMNTILMVAALAATFSVANTARAQSPVGYRATGDDGITASPKYRQFLEEHKKMGSAPASTVAWVGYRATGDDGVTASPKYRQFLEAQKTVPSQPATGTALVGYRAKGDDGVTASPKFRQFLDEHQRAPQIAPLK